MRLSIKSGASLEELQHAAGTLRAMMVERLIRDQQIRAMSTSHLRVIDLQLTRRVIHALHRQNVTTVDALLRLSRDDLLHMPNIGIRSIHAIEIALSAHHLTLAP